MSFSRTFLIAPALARLIRKERGGSRITEGYFAPQTGRVSFVQQDGSECHLVLLSTAANGQNFEERTDVPESHGDALLDVCAGTATFTRTLVPLGGRDVQVRHYVTPAGLDTVSIDFDDADAAQTFIAPEWFDAEVSAEPSYERHAVAIHGVPNQHELLITNAALNAVLDLLEPQFGSLRPRT